MVEKNNTFDLFADEYDRWFDEHPGIYQSEIRALSHCIPFDKKGIEVGAGTGRFSLPFNITVSIDPSINALKIARTRVNCCVVGVAENLPFHNSTFDYALMVTVDCFLKDIAKSFLEVRRVLRNNGEFVMAFIDKNSLVGQSYSARKSHSLFYQNAEFHSVKEIEAFLEQAGFRCLQKIQTIFGLENREYDILENSGNGGFVVIKGLRIN